MPPDLAIPASVATPRPAQSSGTTAVPQSPPSREEIDRVSMGLEDSWKYFGFPITFMAKDKGMQLTPAMLKVFLRGSDGASPSDKQLKQIIDMLKDKGVLDNYGFLGTSKTQADIDGILSSLGASVPTGLQLAIEYLRQTKGAMTDKFDIKLIEKFRQIFRSLGTMESCPLSITHFESIFRDAEIKDFASGCCAKLEQFVRSVATEALKQNGDPKSCLAQATWIFLSANSEYDIHDDKVQAQASRYFNAGSLHSIEEFVAKLQEYARAMTDPVKQQAVMALIAQTQAQYKANPGGELATHLNAFFQKLPKLLLNPDEVLQGKEGDQRIVRDDYHSTSPGKRIELSGGVTYLLAREVKRDTAYWEQLLRGCEYSEKLFDELLTIDSSTLDFSKLFTVAKEASAASAPKEQKDMAKAFTRWLLQNPKTSAQYKAELATIYASVEAGTSPSLTRAQKDALIKDLLRPADQATQLALDQVKEKISNTGTSEQDKIHWIKNLIAITALAEGNDQTLYAKVLNELPDVVKGLSAATKTDLKNFIPPNVIKEDKFKDFLAALS